MRFAAIVNPFFHFLTINAGDVPIGIEVVRTAPMAIDRYFLGNRFEAFLCLMIVVVVVIVIVVGMVVFIGKPIPRIDMIDVCASGCLKK